MKPITNVHVQSLGDVRQHMSHDVEGVCICLGGVLDVCIC